MAQAQGMQECIKLCWECREVCHDALYGYCLPKGGKHAETEHVKVMTDCIQACHVAADFMGRNSRLHKSECAACADVCDACAQSCELLGDEVMENCAEICRRCAASCREMGKMKKAA